METQDLIIFREICRTGSLSAAASNLYLTQSTVSKRLTALEKDLDCRLFDRGRGISEAVPTLAGERFLPLARQILSLAEDARAICRQERKQRIRAAAVDSIGSYYLRDFFAGLSLKRPDWEIDLVMSDSGQICRMVRDHEADVGIVNGEAFFPELSVLEILSEDFLVYTRDPAFRGRDRVSPGDLDPASEIYHVYGSAYTAWHQTLFPEGAARGKVNLVHMALELCREDRDWVLLPASVARALLPDGKDLYALDRADLKRKGYLVTSRRPERRELIREFEGLLLEWRKKE